MNIRVEKYIKGNGCIIYREIIVHMQINGERLIQNGLSLIVMDIVLMEEGATR